MVALADLGAAVEQFGVARRVVVGFAVQHDLGLASFGETEREADVLEAGREAPTLAEGLGDGRQRRDR